MSEDRKIATIVETTADEPHATQRGKKGDDRPDVVVNANEDAGSSEIVRTSIRSKLRSVVAGAGWLALALSLLVCLAVILQVGRIPQLSLFNYVVLYPLAPLPILGALLTRLRVLTLPLGAALALWILVLDGFGFGIGTIIPPRGETIRIISYNIEDWHGPNRQGFYDLVDEKLPDLLALQEVWGPWCIHDRRWDHIRHYQWGDTHARHVGALDTFKTVRYDRLDEYGNAVLLERDGRRFWVASVQFPRGLDAVFGRQFMPTERRIEQGRFAEHMKQWLADKSDVIVIGDFNAVAHSWYMRTLRMRNPWITTGLGVGGTYKDHFPVARIDHVLIKGRIRPLYSSTIHIEDFSNHRGLLFDFSIEDIPPEPVQVGSPASDEEQASP